MNDNIRHEPVTSNFCGYDFVSIRVDGVDFFPISQLPFDPTGNQGFPVPKKYAVQDLKRLHLEGFHSFKFATSLNPKKVNCITEEVLKLVVDYFAFEKGCFFAMQFLRAFFGTHSKVKQRLKSVKPPGLIYLIELDGCLKIGFTTNLEKRILSFKTSNSKVNVIATKKGIISDEYRIHSLLKPDLGKELYSLSRINELLSSFSWKIKDTHQLFS